MKKILALVLCLAMVMTMTGCCILHKWGEATCEDPQTCSECGKTKGEALGHDWEDATCETAKTCLTCGETKGEKLGHDCQWELVGSSNMTGSCSRCGETLIVPADWEILGPQLLVGTWEIEYSYINFTSNYNPAETRLTFTSDGKVEGILLGSEVSYTWEFASVSDIMVSFFLFENGESSFFISISIMDPTQMSILANNGHLGMKLVD